MNRKKREIPEQPDKRKHGSGKEKTRLHPRNKHRERYDFKQLIECCSELAEFVIVNVYKDESIDFSDPNAVKSLNKALLKFYYGIDNWDIPPNYLCPPVPGRADYIHHIADLLRANNFGKIPEGSKIKCLDIGVGANCIYPLIGSVEYGWNFIGSEIDPVAIESAKKIVESNSSINGKIELILQEKLKDFFYGIIQKDEQIDVSICNPPFHASQAEAQSGTMRKIRNLSRNRTDELTLNFGGQSNELWCEGGEKRFVGRMIRESKKFSTSCFWFSSLISKQSNLKSEYDALNNAEAAEVKTIAMGQGNKTSRIVAWTFLTPKEQLEWKKARWQSK